MLVQVHGVDARIVEAAEKVHVGTTCGVGIGYFKLQYGEAHSGLAQNQTKVRSALSPSLSPALSPALSLGAHSPLLPHASSFAQLEPHDALVRTQLLRVEPYH